MRFIYSLSLYFALPVLLCRLWWCQGADAARRQIRQRFGCVEIQSVGCIWLHAVSVGEVVAASPLIEVLLENAGHAILVTTTTSTAKDVLLQRFGGRISHGYIPYDTPGSVRRFLDSVQPSMAIFMETELWPNIYQQLAIRNVPLFLVNARCSKHSFSGYRRVLPLVKQTLSCVTRIGAQTQKDADRYLALGAQPGRVSVTGNMKFDDELPDDYREQVQKLRVFLGVQRKIWVAASTHPGEELVALQSHRRILQHTNDALLVLVPRHPERSMELVRLCDEAGFRSTLSEDMNAAQVIHRQVLIVNELGTLASYYGVADVAFIGGSLVDRGGHNPIEAALAGAPIICGESVENFDEIYAQLKQAEAVEQIQNEFQLAEAVLKFMGDRSCAEAAIEASRAVVKSNRGAVKKTMQLLIQQ